MNAPPDLTVIPHERLGARLHRCRRRRPAQDRARLDCDWVRVVELHHARAVATRHDQARVPDDDALAGEFHGARLAAVAKRDRCQGRAPATRGARGRRNRCRF